MNKSLVQQLVEIDSPSGQEHAVGVALADAMSDRGFQVEVDDVGNVIGQIGQGETSVYLVGHMDTVPGHIPIKVENGLLYGRGSVDAKGCLATFVEAAKAFAESQAMTITVIGCVDEEANSVGAYHLLKTHKSADFVIIGEPSGWDAMTLGYKGSVSLNYFLKKARAHRGMDELTPAEDAVAFYNTLCQSFPDRGAGFSELSLNLSSINTSLIENDEAIEMNLNIRTPLDFDIDTLKKISAELSGNATLNWSLPIPAVLGDKRNALVRAFLGSLRASDAQPKFKRKTGTSDMNLLAAWQCPILAYGPGDSSLDHTPNEHLDLAEYERAIIILKQALMNLEAGVK
jgi:LysW-gamma-L-lysine carboxypeptidase